MDADIDHPIVDKPWTHSVIGFNYQRTSETDSYIDLTLARDNVIRRLRFLNPQEIELEPGFPACSGLAFKDVSSHQLDGIRVKVVDFEASFGAMRFLAQDVVDLDEKNSEGCLGDPLADQLAILVGNAFESVAYDAECHEWAFRFQGNGSIRVACAWRLIS